MLKQFETVADQLEKQAGIISLQSEMIKELKNSKNSSENNGTAAKGATEKIMMIPADDVSDDVKRMRKSSPFVPLDVVKRYTREFLMQNPDHNNKVGVARYMLMYKSNHWERAAKSALEIKDTIEEQNEYLADRWQHLSP